MTLSYRPDPRGQWRVGRIVGAYVGFWCLVVTAWLVYAAVVLASVELGKRLTALRSDDQMMTLVTEVAAEREQVIDLSRLIVQDRAMIDRCILRDLSP